MVRRRLNLKFPPDWEPVGGENRTYRKKGNETGSLRLSLNPPIDIDPNGDEALVEHLRSLVKSTGLDIGSEVHATLARTPIGRLATILFRSPSVGLLQFWLIDSEVAIFASYSMGGLATVEAELMDANGIMKSVFFEDAN